MMTCLIIISLLRGSGNDSFIGVKRCDGTDWGLFAALQGCCFLFLGLGIVVLKREFKEKQEFGYQFSPGDLEATTKNVITLSLVSFSGAFAAAFCGIGPGSIFCPVLVMLGVEPQVATSTGMYVTLYTTLSGTIQLIMYKRINLEYAVYI